MNKPKSDIKKIDGTNFGCPYSGYYDHPFILLQRIMAKIISDNKVSKDGKKANDLMSAINQINMGDTVMSFLLNISSKTDLSPRGFIAMMTFIHDAIANEYKTFM